MEKKAVKITLTGTFQPIFFKNAMKELAQRYGVKGYVRRLDKLIMEVYIEGDHDKVDAMTEECKNGPAHSALKDKTVKEERYRDSFPDFKIFNF